jgi:hypothetical protein
MFVGTSAIINPTTKCKKLKRPESSAPGKALVDPSLISSRK